MLKSKYHTRTWSIKLLSIQWLLLPPIHFLPLDWQNRPLFSTRNDLMCLHHLSAKEWYKYILPFPYNNVANKGLLLWRVMDAHASSCLGFKYHPVINRHNLGQMIWKDWCLNQKFMSLLTHIISTKWNEQIVFIRKTKTPVCVTAMACNAVWKCVSIIFIFSKDSVIVHYNSLI